MGVNEKVKKAFNAKAKARLLDTVSNWKGDWIVKGYESICVNEPPLGVHKDFLYFFSGTMNSDELLSIVFLH